MPTARALKNPVLSSSADARRQIALERLGDHRLQLALGGNLLRAIEPLHHSADAPAVRCRHRIGHDPQQGGAELDVGRMIAGQIREHVVLVRWVAMEDIERFSEDALGIELRQLLANFGRARAKDLLHVVVRINDLAVEVSDHRARADSIERRAYACVLLGHRAILFDAVFEAGLHPIEGGQYAPRLVARFDRDRRIQVSALDGIEHADCLRQGISNAARNPPGQHAGNQQRRERNRHDDEPHFPVGSGHRIGLVAHLRLEDVSELHELGEISDLGALGARKQGLASVVRLFGGHLLQELILKSHIVLARLHHGLEQHPRIVVRSKR